MKKIVFILALMLSSVSVLNATQLQPNKNNISNDYSPAICWDFATAIADLHGGSDDWFEYALNTCIELSEH